MTRASVRRPVLAGTLTLSAFVGCQCRGQPVHGPAEFARLGVATGPDEISLAAGEARAVEWLAEWNGAAPSRAGNGLVALECVWVRPDATGTAALGARRLSVPWTMSRAWIATTGQRLTVEVPASEFDAASWNGAYASRPALWGGVARRTAAGVVVLVKGRPEAVDLR